MCGFDIVSRYGRNVIKLVKGFSAAIVKSVVTAILSKGFTHKHNSNTFHIILYCQTDGNITSQNYLSKIGPNSDSFKFAASFDRYTMYKIKVNNEEVIV